MTIWKFHFRPIKFAICAVTAYVAVHYFGWWVLLPLLIVGSEFKLDDKS